MQSNIRMLLCTLWQEKKITFTFIFNINLQSQTTVRKLKLHPPLIPVWSESYFVVSSWVYSQHWKRKAVCGSRVITGDKVMKYLIDSCEMMFPHSCFHRAVELPDAESSGNSRESVSCSRTLQQGRLWFCVCSGTGNNCEDIRLYRASSLSVLSPNKMMEVTK